MKIFHYTVIHYNPEFHLQLSGNLTKFHRQENCDMHSVLGNSWKNPKEWKCVQVPHLETESKKTITHIVSISVTKHSVHNWSITILYGCRHFHHFCTCWHFWKLSTDFGLIWAWPASTPWHGLWKKIQIIHESDELRSHLTFNCKEYCTYKIDWIQNWLTSRDCCRLSFNWGQFHSCLPMTANAAING